MWRTSELWMRTCETPIAVENAMRDAQTALRLASGRPGARVRRYPQKTLFVSDGQRRIAVSARLTYMHEDNVTYARRFARNNLPKRESQPTVTT
jgi:hypothetical protein